MRKITLGWMALAVALVPSLLRAGTTSSLTSTLDSSLNVYTSQPYYSGITTTSSLVFKRTNTGGLAWSKVINPVSGGTTVGAGQIQVDSSNKLHAVFSQFKSGGLTTNSHFVRKFNTDGSTAWTANVGESVNNSGVNARLVLDTAGNVYVATSSITSSGTVSRILKLNSSGSITWSVPVVPYANTRIGAISIDSSGNVYVGGMVGATGAYDTFFAAKYNSSGVAQWSATSYQGAIRDQYLKVVNNSSGSVHVVAPVSTATGQSTHAVKFLSTGSVAWSYASADADGIVTTAAIVDSAGNLAVTGSLPSGTNLSSPTGYRLVRISGSTGAQLWVKTHNESYLSPAGLAEDDINRYFVASTCQFVAGDPVQMITWIDSNVDGSDLLYYYFYYLNYSAGIDTLVTPTAGVFYATGADWTTANGTLYPLTVKYSGNTTSWSWITTP